MGCLKADLWQAQIVNTETQKPLSTYTRTVLPSLPTTRSFFALEKRFATLEAIAPERLTTRVEIRRAILVVKRLCLVDRTRAKTLERNYERLRNTS